MAQVPADGPCLACFWVWQVARQCGALQVGVPEVGVSRTTFFLDLLHCEDKMAAGTSCSKAGGPVQC